MPSRGERSRSRGKAGVWVARFAHEKNPSPAGKDQRRFPQLLPHTRRLTCICLLLASSSSSEGGTFPSRVIPPPHPSLVGPPSAFPMDHSLSLPDPHLPPWHLPGMGVHHPPTGEGAGREGGKERKKTSFDFSSPDSGLSSPPLCPRQVLDRSSSLTAHIVSPLVTSQPTAVWLLPYQHRLLGNVSCQGCQQTSRPKQRTGLPSLFSLASGLRTHFRRLSCLGASLSLRQARLPMLTHRLPSSSGFVLGSLLLLHRRGCFSCVHHGL